MSYKSWKNLEDVERYAARRYASWDQRWLDRRERAAVKRLMTGHGLSGLILDVPAGYGRFVSVLREAGDVVAADLGFFPLVYLKRRDRFATECVNARAEGLPLKDNSVDAVFCFRLFQHLHNPADRLAVLREFSRVSRKWVVLSVYTSTFVHRLFRQLVPQPSRITMVTQDQFQEELKEAALTAVDHITVVPLLHAQRVYLLSSNQFP
ncbi:MAG: class I SAM-dependent methyltransferase [Fidelibacterota bacterium]